MKRLALVSCLIFGSAVAWGAPKKGVKGEMHQMRAALQELLPLLLDSENFQNKKTRNQILSGTKKLKKHANHLTNKKFPDSDPFINFSVERLNEDLDQSIYLLRKKDMAPLAQFFLNDATRYCIGCHTRTKYGAQNLDLGEPKGLSKLSKAQRGDFFAATRQFPKAIMSYEDALSQPKFGQRDPLAYEQLAMKLLAITVRVKRNAALTQEMVSALRERTDAPPFFKLESHYWTKAAKEWRAEKTQPKSRHDKLKVGTELFEKARILRGQYEFAGLVYALRASTYFHELLSDGNRDTAFLNSLYYAGRTTELLGRNNFWTAPEIYYEACIHEQPRTSMARRCFRRLATIENTKPYASEARQKDLRELEQKSRTR